MKYTGIELLQAIKNEKIKYGTEFKCSRFGKSNIYVKYEYGELNIYQGTERYEENTKYGVISPKDLLTFTFEIIEEKPKKIEKVSVKTNNHNVRKVANKVNEIIDYLLEKESDK